MSSFHEKLAGNIRMYPVLYDKSSPSILLINTQKLFFPYRRKPILNRIISTSFLRLGLDVDALHLSSRCTFQCAIAHAYLSCVCVVDVNQP